jgi:putative membrane protein
MESKKFPTSIIVLGAVVVVAVVLVAVFAYFASTNRYYGYDGYYGGMMGGYGGVWMLFMIPVGLVVLAVIGWIIWRGIGCGGGCCGSGHRGHYASYGDRDNSMEILRQRYARGEISKEQYEQMKKDIVG